MALLLTEEQLAAAAISLEDGKLTPSQVSDLVSIFRGYLAELEANYALESTLSLEDDSDGLGRQRCQKLAACLILFQDNQFTPESGFAPTAANRTGFIYSLDGENFEVFRYAFGLFWPIPKELINKYLGTGRTRTSSQGQFVNTI